jgi:dihydroxyacetone kinase-like predicted kinase
MDILQAVQEVPSDKVIILPNNKNVIPTANLVQSLTAKTIRVIPTETVPQGISALVAFIQEDTFEANVASMAEAAKAVRTLEITRATRDTVANGLEVKQGQVIGLLDGELLEASEKPVDVILHLLTRCCAEQASLVTLYYGKDINTAEAEQAGAGIREHYPHLEVGIVSGGQPNYDYIMSVE